MQDATKYLLEKIHSLDRKRTSVSFFKFKSDVVMLDFVGADKYIITDFGAVWFRPKIYTNTFGILTKGCEPMVAKDDVYGYKWVNLETPLGKVWFPLNQLYGWAFDPQTDQSKRYYVSDLQSTLPLSRSNFHWESEIPFNPNSLYCRYMKSLYA